MRSMIIKVNKTSSRAILFAAAAGLAVGGAACDRDDSAEEAAAPEEEDEDEGEDEAPEREALDYVIDERDGQRYAVSFVPPEDWTEWRPRDPGNVTYQQTSSNRITMGTTCHGNCMNLDEDLADNFDDNAQDDYASIEDNDLAVSWVAEPGETEPGHYFYQAVGENDDGEVKEARAELTRFEDGWGRAVRCTIRVTAEEVDMLDELLDICRNVELTVSELEDE